MKCPYRECDFEGTQAEVDNHLSYMTTMVKDREHQPDQHRAECPCAGAHTDTQAAHGRLGRPI